MAEIGTLRIALLGSLLVSASLPSVAAIAADTSYQDWLRSQRSSAAEIQRQFQDYRSEQDRQFSSHLKTQWQEFQVFQGKVRDPNPKPKLSPVAPPKTPLREPIATKPPVTPPQPPKIEPTLPRIEPTPPRIEPTPPRVEPTPPRIEPTPPRIEPTPPRIEPTPPRIEPTPPRIEPTPPKVEPSPALKPAQPQPTSLPARDRIEVDFYGNVLDLPIDPQWREVRVRSYDSKGFAALWDSLSNTRIQPTLDEVNKVRRAAKLDDWGHVALWQELARALLPGKSGEQNLLLWHFLVKAGVDVRLGYSSDQIYLFVAVKQPVFSTSYIKIGDRTYYALLSADYGKGLQRFKTYDKNYPAPLQALDLTGASTGFTRAKVVQKKVGFQYQGRTVDIRFDYDDRLVRYLSAFPQLGFELYFATDGSPAAKNPLLNELRRRIHGMNEEAALNFLLAFVQKGFEYKTDEDQFGREKYFFVEETLFFPYSDCEDRSAMFAWLVRELLGLKTVGLHYPGHMTTGVAMKTVKPGWASVEWKGQRYVIADPTYINAGIGMAMPSYANLQPLHVIPTP